MPRVDSEGVEHVTGMDTFSNAGVKHILHCPECTVEWAAIAKTWKEGTYALD